MRRPKLACGISILLGAMFVFFAILKITSPRDTLNAFRFLLEVSNWAHELMLIILVSTEIALGYALLVRWRMRSVLMVTMIVLGVFSAAIVEFLRDPNAPSCGCSGSLALLDDARLSNWIALGRNVVMIALAYVGWLCAAPVAGDGAEVLPDGVLESPAPA